MLAPVQTHPEFLTINESFLSLLGGGGSFSILDLKWKPFNKRWDLWDYIFPVWLKQWRLKVGFKIKEKKTCSAGRLGPGCPTECVWVCVCVCVWERERERERERESVPCLSLRLATTKLVKMRSPRWIQNVADPRQNSRIGQVFELAELHVRRNMGNDFCIRAIFPYRNRNCTWNASW